MKKSKKVLFQAIGLILIIYLTLFTVGYIFYHIGKTEGIKKGYTKGYDALNNEIYTAMSKTYCENYIILKNYDREIKLYQEPCLKLNLSSSLFFSNYTINTNFSNLRIKKDIQLKETGFNCVGNYTPKINETFIGCVLK